MYSGVHKVEAAPLFQCYRIRLSLPLITQVLIQFNPTNCLSHCSAENSLSSDARNTLIFSG